MKDFFIVLKFELMNFFKNKTFIISTLIICLIIAIGLSIPTIKDTFFSSSDKGDEEVVEMDGEYGFIDETNGDINIEILKNSFFGGELKEINSVSVLEDKVNSKELDAGFILESPTEYEYVVVNNEMIDSTSSYFEEALTMAYRIGEFSNRGIDYNEVEDLIYPDIQSETRILGKDSAKNYMYTYVLVFGLYFIIILYGQLIASSVASEKSNRAMEILVTSTDTSNLIFGKVLGGALAGILQFGLVILTGGIAYKLNAAAWDGALDFIFKIPASVLLTFSVFGILGYLLFAFIFGALGALVSRVEDISASATPVTILFVVVFMISMIGMQNTEGLLLKIASFVPFSSFMAMFVRVSMGSVASWEIVTSLALLFATTGLIGIFAAKVYRMGTLMYGNRVKLKNVIKALRSE